jgi:YHS domain-containing protein
MKTIRLSLLLAALAMLGSTAAVHAADAPAHKKPAHDPAAHDSAASDSGIPKTYPLKKCVVSDEALGEHGKAVKATAPDGTDVYLCCKDCLKDFNKDPAKYAQMVKDAHHKK